MRTITENEVTIRVTAELDHIPVRGNAMASGDDAADRECEDEILARLDDGDVWAWACVTVRATWTAPSGREYVGVDHLSACCYANEADFRQEGGYFRDMVATALDDLNESLARIGEDLEPLMVAS